MSLLRHLCVHRRDRSISPDPRVEILVIMTTLLLASCAPPAQPAPPTPSRSPAPTLTPRATSSPTPASTVTPAPRATVTPAPTPRPTQTRAPKEEVNTVSFTIIYDNNRYDERLRTAWGFSCLVETGEATVLFDTGGDGPTLMGNMTELDIDPQAIDAVVLSHAHGDHTGGLGGLLDTGARPTVYVPSAFSAAFKDGVRAHTELVEVTGPVEILPGIHTTGELGSGIIEQALALETAEGLVVVTGCAHPGVADMVRRAKESVGGEVYLVMGGFHLGSASPRQIEAIIAEFRDLGVQNVAPCHCTGDQARQMFADAFGDAYTPAGVGWKTTVGSLEGSGR
jgi:7,8-dihydropterin-6-yl-methyl-4-(beta-D-ribofuranosyl)aminobenzene 5'-phosphate synthase